MQTQTMTPNAVLHEVPSRFTQSNTNPRQHFNEDDLNELAETIRKSGVYQAILARPKEERLEIVLGERRYCASLLGRERKTIPALVREMSDAEVLEAQLVENLQRRDVHPMEEAEGYKRPLSLAEPTYTVEQIAAKVGKTPAYITTRLKLTDLCDEACRRVLSRPCRRRTCAVAGKAATRAADTRASGVLQRGIQRAADKPTRVLLPVRNLQFWIATNVLLIAQGCAVQ